MKLNNIYYSLYENYDEVNVKNALAFFFISYIL